ncbi:DNA alkylation repair protein [Mucilaginibacter mali]|uniref:DNA alkylation repair protein n=1 Tax=Mucilaginibacter mali TaxID=2740462 RepID=A0A7D4TVX5_9SPHI|nr:DNA alkylation repair protein [Mucilaginibacter mali]QKJ28917.1 DNA alkylation repair protein [Mucilaginibacter mali]
METLLTAQQFIKTLKTLSTLAEQAKIQRYFKTGDGQYGAGDEFIGVPMGQVFNLAKQYLDISLTELETLLESPIHEARAGAVSIMDKIARDKKTSPQRLEAIYNLYMRRHDRINNWDLVDLGCLYMTGRHLHDKPHDVLYTMALSPNLWERRTAILSTCYFIRQGDTHDVFKIARLLLTDTEDLVHKATGWMLRFAGDKNMPALLDFLDHHAVGMPRVLLRNAIEKLEVEQRAHYLKLK